MNILKCIISRLNTIERVNDSDDSHQYTADFSFNLLLVVIVLVTHTNKLKTLELGTVHTLILLRVPDGTFPASIAIVIVISLPIAIVIQHVSVVEATALMVRAVPFISPKARKNLAADVLYTFVRAVGKLRDIIEYAVCVGSPFLVDAHGVGLLQRKSIHITPASRFRLIVIYALGAPAARLPAALAALAALAPTAQILTSWPPRGSPGASRLPCGSPGRSPGWFGTRGWLPRWLVGLRRLGWPPGWPSRTPRLTTTSFPHAA
mmetsp:Transcript_13979/g.30358  ORF Transcript_13979/g.30358 Transcript_13979/m.30358 type:complete len:263 (-) Transcript_13979:430-1218(-)|eukprot:CAMPEP_0172540906 /NCGR_PEP_ID=MMETSP1067-20121228/11810_1 /TAXON_ID=265564 ORGANISM="Thalassiosira punctigera, Strain Tpunct2005C2" /NCGR_SAMPLE_ID=MMETSP1067 /ASSEMBLY_ACC=CAM_ASM_000444 /LENGTH=262 /DNA_ID=CAMNT_0013326837 /DNA_START=174 /DNA_END=962 /DNA_ORIENTATION=-